MTYRERLIKIYQSRLEDEFEILSNMIDTEMINNDNYRIDLAKCYLENIITYREALNILKHPHVPERKIL